MYQRVQSMLIFTAIILWINSTSVNGKSRFQMGRLFFIPGKSCGVSNAISYLDIDKIPNQLASPEDFVCLIAKSKSDYELAMEKLEIGINVPTSTPTINQPTEDPFDVSHHYPYCLNHQDARGLILKVSTNELKNYDSAEAFCKEDGMEVAVIRTREDFNQIKAYMESPGSFGEMVRFYLNGQMSLGYFGNKTHPCEAEACGSDMIQWKDPGGLPFDATIFGNDWLKVKLGEYVRPCLATKKTEPKSIVGINCSKNRYAVCMARCAGSPPMPTGRFQYCHDNLDEDDLVLIEMGDLSYSRAVTACDDESLQLVVIRTEAELSKVQALIGIDTSFYLAGRTSSNETCTQFNCNNNHIEWLDGGKTYNSTSYFGFLNSEISQGILHSCLQLNVSTSPPTVEDITCTEIRKVVCMVDCAEWKAILANRN